MIRNRDISPLAWELGHAPDKETIPGTFCPAAVPGAVQLDIARAEGYPDYNYADNYRRMTWMEDRFFTYRTEFEPPRLGQGQRLWFVSKGIDYQYETRFNGHLLAAGEGMFSPVEIDLTEYLEPSNRLEVVISPIPKRHPEPADRPQASDVVKPAV